MYDILVVVAAYRGGSYFREALNSVLNQRGVNFKVIISDNSSGGDIAEMLNGYNNNITVRKTTRSLSGVEHFKYIVSEIVQKQDNFEFFCIMHEDDIMSPVHLLDSLKALQYRGVGAVASRSQLIDKFGNTLSNRFSSFYPFSIKFKGVLGLLMNATNSFTFPSMVYKRCVFECENLFEKVDFCDGYIDYGSNLIIVYNYGIFLKKKSTFFYRVHEGQDSLNYRDRHKVLHRLCRCKTIKLLRMNKFKENFIILVYFVSDKVRFFLRWGRSFFSYFKVSRIKNKRSS